MENKVAQPRKPAPFTSLLDRAGISKQRQHSLLRFFRWFKRPSNLLSLAAIVAVVIVPWIEKVVKSDEELRTKIDSLIDTTNSIVAMNQQRMSTPGLDMIGNGILASQRENKLARARAIASSIRHDAYPSVLFALSNELCSSGQFEDAQGYLTEVLKRGTWSHFLSTRPSVEELAQAHVVSGRCHAEESQGAEKAGADYKKLADEEMSAAASLLEHDESDRVLGQLAIIYVEWAEVDQKMGETTQSQLRRQKAIEIAKKMRSPDPGLNSFVGLNVVAEPQPSTLNEDSLPRSPEGDTYFVSFPEDANEVAALILPRSFQHGHFDSSGTLFLYYRGLFTEADEFNYVNHVNSKNGRPGLTAIGFQRSIPTPSVSGTTPKVETVWTIEKMDEQSLMGIQSRVGRPPRRFLAKLSVPH